MTQVKAAYASDVFSLVEHFSETVWKLEGRLESVLKKTTRFSRPIQINADVAGVELNWEMVLQIHSL